MLPLPQDLYTLIKGSSVTLVADNAKSKGVRDRKFKRRLPSSNNGVPLLLNNHYPPSGIDGSLRGNLRWEEEGNSTDESVRFSPPVRRASSDAMLLPEIFEDLSMLDEAASQMEDEISEAEEEKSDDYTLSTTTSTTANSMNSSLSSVD